MEHHYSPTDEELYKTIILTMTINKSIQKPDIQTEQKSRANPDIHMTKKVILSSRLTIQ